MRVAVLFLALLLSSVARAGPSPMDVFGHPIAPLLSLPRPKLILYGSKKTEDRISGPGDAMAVRLKDIPYITVVYIDLRGLPHFLQGFARLIIQGQESRNTAHYRDLCKAGGISPAACGDRMFLVAEADGAAHQAMGMPQGFSEPLAVVLDDYGREILRTPFPSGIAAVEKAIRAAAHLPAPPPAAPPAGHSAGAQHP